MLTCTEDFSTTTLIIKNVAALLPKLPRSRFSGCSKIARVICVSVEQRELRLHIRDVKDNLFLEGVCEVGVLRLSGILLQLRGELRRTNLLMPCFRSYPLSCLHDLNEAINVSCLFYSLPIMVLLITMHEGRFISVDFDDIAWTRCCFDGEHALMEAVDHCKLHQHAKVSFTKGPIVMRIHPRDLYALGAASTTQHNLMTHIQSSSITSYLLGWQDLHEHRASLERIYLEAKYSTYLGWCYWLTDTVLGSCHKWMSEQTTRMNQHEILNSRHVWATQLPEEARHILPSSFPLCEPLPQHSIFPPSYVLSLPLLSPWALAVRSNHGDQDCESGDARKALSLFETHMECLHFCIKDEIMFTSRCTLGH
jgi:hypothetical protein